MGYLSENLFGGRAGCEKLITFESNPQASIAGPVVREPFRFLLLFCHLMKAGTHPFEDCNSVCYWRGPKCGRCNQRRCRRKLGKPLFQERVFAFRPWQDWRLRNVRECWKVRGKLLPCQTCVDC